MICTPTTAGYGDAIVLESELHPCDNKSAGLRIHHVAMALPSSEPRHMSP